MDEIYYKKSTIYLNIYNHYMWDIISTEIILTLRTRLEHKRKIDLTPLFQPSKYLFNKIFVQPQQTYER